MGYRVVGSIIKDVRALDLKVTPYKSKVFKNDRVAQKHAYSLVYQKDGNTKRTKNVLVNFYIDTV